jgi:hypothetical protein
MKQRKLSGGRTTILKTDPLIRLKRLRHVNSYLSSQANCLFT